VVVPGIDPGPLTEAVKEQRQERGNGKGPAKGKEAVHVSVRQQNLTPSRSALTQEGAASAIIKRKLGKNACACCCNIAEHSYTSRRGAGAVRKVKTSVRLTPRHCITLEPVAT
jgi:hypothetical protein